jgi:large subunit ribosomal protein L21
VYAVIATGGKQLRVEPGQEVRVELIEGAIGDQVDLRPVLVVSGDGDVVVGDAVSVPGPGEAVAEKVAEMLIAGRIPS